MSTETRQQHPLVLVHGSMHGPWCFDKLIPFLEPCFARIVAVDVLHVDSIAKAVDIIGKVIDDLCLSNKSAKVVLLGHSFGGIYITQAAEVYSDKILRLIYLSAYLPVNGEGRKEIQIRFNVHLPFSHTPDSAFVVPASKSITRDCFYNECSQETVDWAFSLLRPQPTGPLSARVSIISQQRFGAIPKVYIMCLRDRAIPIECQKWMVARGLTEQGQQIRAVHSLDTDHFPQLSCPQKLASLIIQDTAANL